MAIPRFGHGPRILRALLAQAAAFVLLVLAARAGLRLPGWGWAALQGGLAALLAAALGLPRWWAPLQAALPFALLLRLTWAYPPWVDFALLAGLALVYGGGLWTRVPLYNASRDAWTKLEQLLPAQPGFIFLDLGCGLGGPVSHLAARRPDGTFLGVEASPLTWLLAWLRCLRRSNAKVLLGSLWSRDLGGCDLVYAFLSPEPMPALWAKAKKEMKPGSLFVSHTFDVPGYAPNRILDVEGRHGARLLVWEM
jgi:SAM-dependent methyltransferase